jgi:hypothetical protein
MEAPRPVLAKGGEAPYLAPMARRASSSAHPIWMIAAAVLLLGAVAGGYFSMGA